MIASQKALRAAVETGQTVSLLRDMSERSSAFRWCLTATGERVSRGAVKALADKGVIQPLQRDLCGDPMQYGAAETA